MVRYINAIILQKCEDDLLSSIDDAIKSDPSQFLEELKRLKEEKGLCNFYVLDKLIVQAEIWQFVKSSPKFKNFPFEAIWRFCIDVEFHKYGAYIFENEPGYILAILKALYSGLTTKTISYLDCIEINKQAGENVLCSVDSYDKLKIGLRNEQTPLTAYGIYELESMDQEGLADLREKHEKGVFRFNGSRVFLHQNIPIWIHLRELAFLIDYHRKKIEQAQNEGERLLAHIWLSREISVQHFFQDANGRMAQIVLLLLLLNDVDLPMMLLDTNPNWEINGPEAYSKRVLQAMTNFSKICGNETIPLTFEEFEKLTHVSEKRLWSHYHPTDEERKAFFDQHPEEEFKALTGELIPETKLESTSSSTSSSVSEDNWG